MSRDPGGLIGKGLKQFGLCPLSRRWRGLFQAKEKWDGNCILGNSGGRVREEAEQGKAG